MKKIRCEGYTRKGGVFTLGPVIWHQCENEAIVNIEFEQIWQGKKEEITILPSCKECWQKGIDSENIKILSVEPIKED